MKTKICVLHEYGAESHYLALKVLAQKKGCEISFYTFGKILNKSIIVKFKYLIAHPVRAVRDIWFLFTLPFKRSLKIVIGIAPYNNNLPLLMKLMTKHDVFYHTSYSCWDGIRYVHKPNSERNKEIWREFTNNYVKHIFAVSDWTKKQLIMNNFAKDDMVSVVNHSYAKIIDADAQRKKTLNFVSVAALIPQKGINALLEFFSKHPEMCISFVGKGELKSKVLEYARVYSNIDYLGYINGAEKIMPIYKEKSFLILNSIRTEKWEELFGMVIIEGMSCGCIPITTDHPGPMEIIDNGVDGIICKEGEIESGIEMAFKMSDDEYLKMRKAALRKGRSYHCELMANRWQEIFTTEV